MTHVVMISVPRDANYVHETIRYLFDRADGPVKLDIYIGALDEGYLAEYKDRDDITLHFMSYREVNRMQPFRIHAKFSANYLRALRGVSNEGSLVIEDDIELREHWDTCLHQAVEEISANMDNWALACYAPGGTPSSSMTNRSLLRGHYYCSYIATTFFGTQAMFYTKEEAVKLVKKFEQKGFDKEVWPRDIQYMPAGDLFLRESFASEQNLYATVVALAQHKGMQSTGVGWGHRSETFDLPWPSPKIYKTGRILGPDKYKVITDILENKNVIHYKPNGNPGDDLIHAATFDLFKDFNVKHRNYDGIYRGEDYLVIGGGGNLGGFYPAEFRKKKEALNFARANNLPVVVLPQSIPDGKILDDFSPNTTVFLREARSLEIYPQGIFAPDLASYFTPKYTYPDAVEDIGVFLRVDGERTKFYMKSKGDPAFMCRTLREYFELAARYHCIITNRLHFAVCGMLLSRRVILLDNNYGKNRGVWEATLKDLGCLWLEGS